MPTIAGVHAVADLTADADFPGVGITVIFVVADVLSILVSLIFCRCRQPPAFTSVLAVSRALQILVSLLLLMSPLLLAPMLLLVFLPSVTGVSLSVGVPTCCVVVTCSEILHVYYYFLLHISQRSG
jgi:hypothetical protein